MDELDNQQLTRRERKLLKKQEKEEGRLRLARRKKIKKTAVLAVALILVFGGMIYIGTSYSKEKNQNISGAPKLEINSKEYDAGTVSMADGLVEHTYEIKNAGDCDLEISNIKTSCMCTTAVLSVGGKKSLKFGMHNNPKFWSQKISPGEEANLEVAFDPAFHGPQGTGQAVRVIYFSTNDPKNKKSEVRLLANVTK